MDHQQLKDEIAVLIAQDLATYEMPWLNDTQTAKAQLPAIWVGPPPQGTRVIEQGVECTILAGTMTQSKPYLGGPTRDRVTFTVVLDNWLPTDIDATDTTAPKLPAIGLLLGPKHKILRRYSGLSAQVGNMQPDNEILERCVIEIYPEPCINPAI